MKYTRAASQSHSPSLYLAVPSHNTYICGEIPTVSNIDGNEMLRITNGMFHASVLRFDSPKVVALTLRLISSIRGCLHVPGGGVPAMDPARDENFEGGVANLFAETGVDTVAMIGGRIKHAEGEASQGDRMQARGGEGRALG